MNRISAKRRGLTLTEVVVVAATTALGVAVLLPGLAAAREESFPALCGANLLRIGQGYSFWAGDQNGFCPPRCRADAGCPTHTVEVGLSSPGTKRTADMPYCQSPNDGLGIVGQPPLDQNSPTGVYGAPGAIYRGANDFCLDPWVIPNWKPGIEFPVTACPSDRSTLKAPSNTDVYGVVASQTIASSFELHGTSYGTNIEPLLPWRGHGVWASATESAINLRAGPNYNPEKIYNSSRYVVMIDLENFFYNWQALMGDSIGSPSGVGAWHEAAPPPTQMPQPCEHIPNMWVHGNALFGDLHVQFREYDIPFKGITLTRICDYVTAEWSLYPYKRRALDIQNTQGCCN